MFSKFSSVLHQAVEAFSSGTTPEQDFISHWKAVTNYFIDNKEHKVSIEHTVLGHHFSCMFDSLQQTDHRDKTGPCLEYVLQHKILDTLATLARTDTPPGMKQEVLLFFTKLLSRLQYPLLPHVHVHKPVQRLVRLCGEQRAGPTETEEIRFLCTLCARLKAQPDLVGFFIESAEEPLSLCNGQIKPAITNQPGSPTKQHAVFPLVKALLSLMHSHDARVAVKSCEGLMLICSLRESACGQSITKSTDLGAQLASKMITLYRGVPRNLSSLDIETAQAKWGFDIHTSREDDRYFPGKQQLLSLLSWLDYCDELVSMAMPQVAEEVAHHIRSDFLSACVKNDLLQTSESGAITSMCILTRCLYCVHSKPLVSEFSHFLLDDVQDSLSSPPHPVSVRQRLIERCNHLSNQVSLCSLKLFDTLLLKSDIHIFETLLLRYLETGGYKVPACDEVQKTDKPQYSNSQNQEEGSHLDQCEEKIKDCEKNESEGSDDKVTTFNSTSDKEGGEGDGLSPQHSGETMETTASGVHRVVNSFLNLVPMELRSSPEVGDTGYDTYLRDAHQQYSNTCLQCKDFSWASVTSQQPIDNKDNADNIPFTEGEFLKMLLDRLSRILDQSYELNLQLTSILYKLCLLPHPSVHEYFLDPRLTPTSRTLYSVLTKVCTDLKERMKHLSNVSPRLQHVRRQLSMYNQDVNSIEDGQLLASIITLEEFCKELAAIAFVKHHQL